MPDETSIQAEWLNPTHPCRGKVSIPDPDAGSVELLSPDGGTRRKKFALIGFASSSRGYAPLADPEWAVVGMNQLQRHLVHKGPDGNPVVRHGDLWFEIHENWNDAVVPGTDHAAWLRDAGIPVLMTKRTQGIPTSVRYPIERLSEKFGLDYFTSTVAFMLAYVLDYIDAEVTRELAQRKSRMSPVEGIGLVREIYGTYTIGIFGIDLIVGEEWDYQRPCAEFWLGQILARNITLVIPPSSALLKQRYRYGYQAEPDDLIKDSDLGKRRQYLMGEHQKHSEAVVQLVGALKELSYWEELRRLRERGGVVG